MAHNTRCLEKAQWFKWDIRYILEWMKIYKLLISAAAADDDDDDDDDDSYQARVGRNNRK